MSDARRPAQLGRAAARFAAQAQAGATPGGVLMARQRGEIIVAEAAGLARESIAMTLATPFQVMSVSKAVVAFAIAVLEDRGWSTWRRRSPASGRRSPPREKGTSRSWTCSRTGPAWCWSRWSASTRAGATGRLSRRPSPPRHATIRRARWPTRLPALPRTRRRRGGGRAEHVARRSRLSPGPGASRRRLRGGQQRLHLLRGAGPGRGHAGGRGGADRVLRHALARRRVSVGSPRVARRDSAPLSHPRGRRSGPDHRSVGAVRPRLRAGVDVATPVRLVALGPLRSRRRFVEARVPLRGGAVNAGDSAQTVAQVPEDLGPAGVEEAPVVVVREVGVPQLQRAGVPRSPAPEASGPAT